MASLTSFRSDSPTNVRALQCRNERSQLERRRKRESRSLSVPSFLSSTSSTSYSMKVDFDRFRHLVIDDMFNTLDIETAHHLGVSIPIKGEYKRGFDGLTHEKPNQLPTRTQFDPPGTSSNYSTSSPESNHHAARHSSPTPSRRGRTRSSFDELALSIGRK